MFLSTRTYITFHTAGKTHKRNIPHSFPVVGHFCPWEVAVYNAELFCLLGI